jgi:hypothetical protein
LRPAAQTTPARHCPARNRDFKTEGEHDRLEQRQSNRGDLDPIEHEAEQEDGRANDTSRRRQQNDDQPHRQRQSAAQPPKQLLHRHHHALGNVGLLEPLDNP